MIRFSAKEVSVEIDNEASVVELLQTLVRKISSVDNAEEGDSKKKRSEYNRRYYQSKKNSTSEISELNTENTELRNLSVENVETEDSEKILNSEILSTDISENLLNKKNSEIEKVEILEKEEKERTKEKEEKELINNTLANAKVSGEKTKLTPNDSDFWKFAKENSHFAEEFFKATGIFPVKKEFGRWVNDLRDLAEAGITVQLMKSTVAYMKAKNLPIGAPGSILKTARWLMVNPQTALKNNVQQINQPKKTYTFADIFAMEENNSGEVIDL